MRCKSQRRSSDGVVVRVDRTECIERATSVGHIDQLGEAAVAHLACMYTGGLQRSTVPPDVMRAFGGFEYVKFTSYYRVDRR